MDTIVPNNDRDTSENLVPTTKTTHIGSSRELKASYTQGEPATAVMYNGYSVHEVETMLAGILREEIRREMGVADKDPPEEKLSEFLSRLRQPSPLLAEITFTTKLRTEDGNVLWDRDKNLIEPARNSGFDDK